MKRKQRMKCQVAGLFTLALMFILLPGPKVLATTQEEEAIKTMKLVAENEYLELYLDEKDTDIAVKVKESGDIWFTNPINAEEDSLATPYNKKLLRSQFSLKYYNESVQISEMDNFNDSIQNEQFEIANNPDGVTITYTLGDMAIKLILPSVISEERYLNYFNQMDEKAQKQIKRNYSFLSLGKMKEADKSANLKTYPSLSERNIYILKKGTKDFKQEELMEYFVAVGYTAKDMENDKVDNGYVSTDSKPYFIVPMTYQLEDDNLLVSIVPSEVEYNTDGNYLIDIDLLEYFGAAGTEDNGYLFVPDGSGALIDLNNGKTSKQSYNSQVYGQDKTNNMMITKKSDIAENLTIKLPVFGIKSNDKALFGMIEDGEAFADISADISGRTNLYNNVYAGFTYLQNGAISLGEIIGSNSFQMYAAKPYEKEYKIRYAFLTGEDANYSGMANYYREYLVEKGQLKKTKAKDDLPFYVEYVGAINKTKSFLGIKYESTQALTTYKQATEITENLLNEGIENIKIKYSGWMNGGLGSEATTKVKPVSQLGKGGLSIREFISNMSGIDIPIYVDANLQFVYKDTLFDGFSTSKYSPRYFDKTIVKTGSYLIPNGLLTTKDISLISPYFVNMVADKFMKGANKFNLQGVSVGSLATDLFSDFMPNRLTDRQQAVRFNMEAMEKLAGKYENGLIGNNANAYAFPYVSDLLEAPMDSNHFYILDETIPFYEMVIRGYVEYAGNPLNLTDDYKEGILKSIETGAGIYFKWIYADNSAVKETEYDYLYSVHYGYWIDKATKDYKTLNQVFSKLQGQTIVKHEEVQDNVYEVTYEKGTVIAVNYNKYEAKVNGIIVKPKDFVVAKEGR